MSRLPGISTELAAAIRKVNAAYLAIPERHRPAAAPWAALELEVDAARAAGDRDRALAAIYAWREHHVARFTTVLLNAPLDYEKERARERMAAGGRKASPGHPEKGTQNSAGLSNVREATAEAGRKFGVSRDSVEDET